MCFGVILLGGGHVMLRLTAVAFALALPIAACSDEVEPVSVSGTESCREVAPAGDELNRYMCLETLDDERVSGTSTVTVTVVDYSVSPVVDEGTFTLVNDGGTWSGDWSGLIEDDGTHLIDGVMVGSGGYDGLVYRARWVFTSQSNIEATGTIESAS